MTELDKYIEYLRRRMEAPSTQRNLAKWEQAKAEYSRAVMFRTIQKSKGDRE